jgi:hypothetical protein
VQGSAADRCRGMVLARRSIDSWTVLVGLRSGWMFACAVDGCLYGEFRIRDHVETVGQSCWIFR